MPRVIAILQAKIQIKEVNLGHVIGENCKLQCPCSKLFQKKKWREEIFLMSWLFFVRLRPMFTPRRSQLFDLQCKSLECFIQTGSMSLAGFSSLQLYRLVRIISMETNELVPIFNMKFYSLSLHQKTRKKSFTQKCSNFCFEICMLHEVLFLCSWFFS